MICYYRRDGLHGAFRGGLRGTAASRIMGGGDDDRGMILLLWSTFRRGGGGSILLMFRLVS